MCTSIDSQSNVDIVEIDAASYTGVDNIREIIEKAQFLPSISKYKVYIIDEVHMLSKGAFNALLKILEEPPVHVKFILATTEIHKVPETILSRCQRYDFRSIDADVMRRHLQMVAEKEGIEIDSESLDFIVSQASGGLRNALSLFEQLIIEGKITYAHIVENYGIPKKETLEELYTTLFEKNAKAMTLFSEIVEKYSLLVFFREFLFFVKDQALESMQDAQKTRRHIEILEHIETAYRNTKHSVDVQTPFFIGILKCISENEYSQLSSHSETVPIASKPSLTISKPVQIWEDSKNTDFSNVPESIKPNTSPLPKNPEPEKTSYEDIASVFATPSVSSEKTAFQKEIFIETLKKLTAPGALTMALKLSTLQLSDTTLKVFTTGKLYFKNISTPESFELMQQAFQEMGFWDITIEVV